MTAVKYDILYFVADFLTHSHVPWAHIKVSMTHTFADIVLSNLAVELQLSCTCAQSLS